MNINLLKYGFERDKENDFTDDGSRFTAYKFKADDRVTATKCISCGSAYVDICFRANVTGSTKYFSDANGVDKDLADGYIEKAVNDLNKFLAEEAADYEIAFNATDEAIIEYVSSHSLNDVWNDELVAEYFHCKRCNVTYDFRHRLEDAILAVQYKHTDDELTEIAKKTAVNIVRRIAADSILKYALFANDLSEASLKQLFDKYECVCGNICDAEKAIIKAKAFDRLKTFFIA